MKQVKRLLAVALVVLVGLSVFGVMAMATDGAGSEPTDWVWAYIVGTIVAIIAAVGGFFAMRGVLSGLFCSADC